MKYLFKVSIAFNILIFIMGIFIILNFPVVNYLKLKYNNKMNVEVKKRFGVSYQTKKDVMRIYPSSSNDIIFLGNSITESCQWSELFQNPNIKNRGISGDVIPGVIARIDDITNGQPKKMFLMIGINDLIDKVPVNEIVKNYGMLISEIQSKSPKTELFVQSVLPTNNYLNMKNKDIVAINKGLHSLSEKFNITYIDLFSVFADSKDNLNTFFTYDGLHINGRAYLLWKSEITKYVN